MARFTWLLFLGCAHRVEAKRVFLHLPAALGIVFLYSAPLRADVPFEPSPLVSIVYTAETKGAVHVCASCDGSLGGLARRAPALAKISASRPGSLIIAGSGEFYADREEGDPAMEESLTRIWHAAFEHMPYNAVYVSLEAAACFARAALPPPSNGVVVAQAPVVRFFRAGRLVVGCVFFPQGLAENNAPTADQIHAVRQAGAEAAAKTDLVVGVSPWGMRAENACTSLLAGYFHILLGGGPGVAVSGQATGDHASPGPLWVRSDRLGRAVTVLDVFAIPDKAAPQWLDGLHFSSRFALLDASIPQDEILLESIALAPEGAE